MSQSSKRVQKPSPSLVCPDKKASGNKLAKGIGQLYPSHVFSDFVLETSDGREFPVHRLVLAARSKVFLAMFTMANSKEVQTGRCEVKDVDGPTMDMLLKYIYGIHKVGFVRGSADGLNLLYPAEKYDLRELVQLCAAALQTTLTKENATDVLLAADQFSLLHLKQAAVKIIARDRREFIRSGQLERVRKQSVERMEEALKGIPNSGEILITTVKVSDNTQLFGHSALHRVRVVYP